MIQSHLWFSWRKTSGAASLGQNRVERSCLWTCESPPGQDCLFHHWSAGRLPSFHRLQSVRPPYTEFTRHNPYSSHTTPPSDLLTDVTAKPVWPLPPTTEFTDMPASYPIAKDKERLHHRTLPNGPALVPSISLTLPANHLRGTCSPSSRYLSPIQEARIRSWRDHTDSSPELTPPPIHENKKKVRSAPATLAMPPSSSGEHSSSHSRGRGSAPSHTKSRESSSSHPAHHHHDTHYRPSSHPHSQSPSQGRMRSYYSSKKKGSSTVLSPSTTPAPMTPMPTSPPPDLHPGMTQEQLEMYQRQSRVAMPPEEQASAAQIPPPVLAAPPNPAPPRIAGARDPISQN